MLCCWKKSIVYSGSSVRRNFARNDMEEPSMETETTMTKNLYINYNACDSQFFFNTAFAQHFLVYDVLLFMTVHCFLSKLLFQPFMILSLFDYVRCIDYHVVGMKR